MTARQKPASAPGGPLPQPTGSKRRHEAHRGGNRPSSGPPPVQESAAQADCSSRVYAGVVQLQPGETPAAALVRVTGKGGRRRNKYGAVRTNGYASKAEARYAAKLTALKASGAILDWLEQVAIKLPGGIRYVVDFLVIGLDGTVRFVEVKGYPTAAYKLKMRLLNELRPEIAKRLEVVR
jgi:uncharacterized protein DUF1064